MANYKRFFETNLSQQVKLVHAGNIIVHFNDYHLEVKSGS